MSPPDLEQPVLWSLLGGGFVAAFLHAALPTHWLPFVLVGRAQRWSLSRNLLAVTAAGLAHIASTAVVGSLIVAAGMALDEIVAGVLPHLSAILLFGFGGFYLVRSFIRRPAMAGGPPLDLAEPTVSHAAAFWGLVAVMALSPGEVLRNMRLDAAHAQLARNDGASVTEVALNCGFSHLSRFAACYRERFGQLPRDTSRDTLSAPAARH